MTNSIPRVTCILLALVVWTSMAAARMLPEEPTLTPGSDQPLPFRSEASVISSNPEATVLEIIVTPTDHHRLLTDRWSGLGLVAVSHTGRIRATVVEVEASRLSDLEGVHHLSAD